MTGIISHTGKTIIQVTPDKTSIIIRSTSNPKSQLYWPVSDWVFAKNYIDGELGINYSLSPKRQWFGHRWIAALLRVIRK